MMRVVLLVTDLERGGTPLRLARLATDLRDLGCEVHVGCLAPPGPVGAELEKAGISTFACDARGPYDVLTFRRLARRLRIIRPDIVHATLTHANVAARVVGRWLGIPVATSTATIEVERRRHLRLERWTSGWDRGHIVNSRAVAEHVMRAFGLPAEKVHVVPPAVATPRERLERVEARRRFQIPENSFAILWAGRFDPVKRIDLAIRCASQLANLNAHLLLAGDGPLRETVRGWIAADGARERIRQLGWQDDLGAAMSAADALLVCSLTEGMPNAALQAMAFGLPTVGSDIPALRELAGDEQRLLIAKTADVRGLVEMLRLVREDAAGRDAMVERAARWVREHADPLASARAIRTVYATILGER